MSIADNIEIVKQRISLVASSCGRNPDDITLVAVSKTMDASYVNEAVNAGLHIFGENKPQELRDKIPLVDNAKWHMIGHLQSNKIKYVAGKVELIHSIDSIELLKDLDNYCYNHQINQDILIQINISKEESKSGIMEEDIDKMLENAQKCSNLRVKGLMTIGQANIEKEKLKKMFEKCYNIFIDKKSKTYDNIDMKYLSMGMSGDFETAIECGSNIVRIGSAIFGKRNYNI